MLSQEHVKNVLLFEMPFLIRDICLVEITTYKCIFICDIEAVDIIRPLISVVTNNKKFNY